MEKRIRHLEPKRRILPGRPQFIVVLKNVFIATVCRQLIRASCTADGGLETPIARDGVVSQYAAVAPSTDGEAFLIRDAVRDQEINAGQQVLDFLVAPIGEYGLRECGATTAA